MDEATSAGRPATAGTYRLVFNSSLFDEVHDMCDIAEVPKDDFAEFSLDKNLTMFPQVNLRQSY
ncbi:MAG: hypothetical protein R3C17_07060 [Planctomycetaceae bacterium]